MALGLNKLLGYAASPSVAGAAKVACPTSLDDVDQCGTGQHAARGDVDVPELGKSLVELPARQVALFSLSMAKGLN